MSHSKVETLLVLVRTLTEFYKFFFLGAQCLSLLIWEYTYILFDEGKKRKKKEYTITI